MFPWTMIKESTEEERQFIRRAMVATAIVALVKLLIAGTLLFLLGRFLWRAA